MNIYIYKILTRIKKNMKDNLHAIQFQVADGAIYSKTTRVLMINIVISFPINAKKVIVDS